MKQILRAGDAVIRVLVVRDTILDRHSFSDVNRTPSETLVPILIAKCVEERLGGAANVLTGAAALEA